MTPAPKIRVRVWDQMVLIGIGLALFYTVFESILSIFLQVNVDFMQRIFGAGPSTIYGRLTILCLFAIFGSHAQYTINLRKQAETALRESEERFRRIIESSPVGYCELDLQGGFTFFNDATCEILGTPREALAGMGQNEVADPSTHGRLAENFERVRATGETAKSVDWVLVRQDKTKRFAESSISLLRDARGRPSGFSVFFRDVTERKRSEALLRAKLAAEAASRTKGEFLASMSHEIRTPLNAIIGLVELLLNTDLRSDQREDLDVVKSSAYALLAIINNVLDFSKIEAGKLELERTPFSLEQFLDEAVKIMAMKAHAKNLELAYRIDAGVPDRLVGDPNRLRQVVLNLVDNAIKFTERGEVIVQVLPRELTAADARLQFTVTDTGIGVPPEKQRSIFEPYDQGDPTVSRRYGGTGLGLAVSAQLVRLMDGRIGVRSRPGEGSAFGFTARFGRAPDAAGERPAEPPWAGRRVLVVDDSAGARRILGELLERAQMIPQAVAGAVEARQAVRSEPAPDAVLVDSDMPGTDGFAFIAWLRGEAKFAGPVIMMLTFPHLKRKSECTALGVSATLVKPCGFKDLVRAFTRTAAGGRDDAARSPAIQGAPAQGGRPLRVLVAEDTPFNQKFILRLLERWGHTAVVAADGRQAVDAFAKGGFDVVLMDVQMPEMDGLEAAAAIRQREAVHGGRTPIVAMTAHAIKGDRERCLAAGMDDYVSKPIDVDLLKHVIDRRVADRAPADVEAALMAPSKTAELLKAFDNDWGFLTEVVEVFFSDYPLQVEALRRSAGSGDAAAFRRAAHSLKGMLRNFQAETAAEKAFELEKIGLAGALGETEALIDALGKDLKQLEQELRGVLTKKNA
jgi:PAS domain S-box-containing protein